MNMFNSKSNNGAGPLNNFVAKITTTPTSQNNVAHSKPVINNATVTTQPPVAVTGMQSLIMILSNSAFRLSTVRSMIEDLNKEPQDRVQFKGLSQADALPLKEFLLKQLSSLNENFINGLDPEDPTSVRRLRNLESEELDFPIEIRFLTEPNPRFEKKALQMFENSAVKLGSAEGVDAMFDLHNGSQYCAYVDERKKDFTMPWVSILHKYAAQIAERDIESLLELPPKEEKPDSIEDVVFRMNEAEKIINRRILSTEVRNNLLEKFQPVLEAVIDYLLVFARDRVFNRYLSRALDIRHELYEKKPEVAVEEIEQPAAEVIATTEVEQVVELEQPVLNEEETVNNVNDAEADFNRRAALVHEKLKNANEASPQTKTTVIKQHHENNNGQTSTIV